jgi:isoamylase
VHRFVTLLNARRVLRDVEHERQWVALNQLLGQAHMTWHGVKLGAPDWGHSSVADRGPHPWRRWIDTFLDSPHDIIEWERAPLVAGHTYRAEPRSVVILFAGLESEREN